MAEREPTETIPVPDPVTACDGGGGALGHPRVYLNITAGGFVDCPYCSRRFVLTTEQARATAH